MGRMRDKSAHTTADTSRLRSVEGEGEGRWRGSSTLLNQMQLQDKRAFALRAASRQGRAGCNDFHTRINQSNGSSRNGNRARGGEEGAGTGMACGEVQPDCHKVKFYDCQRIITHSLSLPISGTSSLSPSHSLSTILLLPLSSSLCPSLFSSSLQSRTSPRALEPVSKMAMLFFCRHLDATDAGVKCLAAHTHTHSHTLTYDTPHMYTHVELRYGAQYGAVWSAVVAAGRISRKLSNDTFAVGRIVIYECVCVCMSVCAFWWWFRNEAVECPAAFTFMGSSLTAH